MCPIPEGGFPRAGQVPGTRPYDPTKLNGYDGVNGTDQGKAPRADGHAEDFYPRAVKAAIQRAMKGKTMSEEDEDAITAEIIKTLNL